MAVAFESGLLPHHMRVTAHASPASLTTTTTLTTTTSTSSTTLPASRNPIPILITAPPTPSPSSTPRSVSASTIALVTDASNRVRKRLAPGLQARLRRFEQQQQSQQQESDGDGATRRRHSIGRIPEEQLAELERLQQQQKDEQLRQQQQHSVALARRGRPWTSSAAAVPADMPVSGGVRLSGGPVWTDNEVSMPESGDDYSSVIDISEDLAGETTEDDEAAALYLDKHKYRLPSPGKTRLHLHTKEPLSPSPRPAVASMPPTSPPRTSAGPAANASAFPPTPPPKDARYMPQHFRNASVDTVSDSDWTSGTGVSRAGSIYSLSRVSFTGQLSQLTSMRLPDASSLSKRILSMASAAEAARALSDASEQIRLWISKASEVLDGLDAEDDVEWAAAGGQEGIEDVDDAIKRFEQLVQVYILSIERLQTRADIALLPHAELMSVVRQMETIVASWQEIKDTLKGVKDQVEIAIEWMRLWNSVLGEIGQEMEALNSLVFEMEEKRHQHAGSLLTSRDSIGIDELETIVEDQPGRMKVPGNGSSSSSNRLSIPAFFPTSPLQTAAADKEDSSLLALFARMQPLRASLDFLPMRLSTFHARGGQIFPSACQDLNQRREELESQWNKLEADADSVRRELGEDKWVLVFRNAGRQALKMCESITRSYSKLRDAVDFGEHQTNIPSIAKKIENYEAKKTHYGPAIERVLSIIDRGVQDRLTVNGEILRLQSEMRQRWAALQVEMREVDLTIDDFTHQTRDKELRDSVSTVVSSERSLASSLVETPGSSPASSVISHSRRNSLHGSRTPTALHNAKVRSSSKGASQTTNNTASTTTTTTGKSAARLSSSSLPRRSLLPRASVGSDLLTSPVSSSSSAAFSTTTPSKPSPSSTVAWPASIRPDLQPSNRPRWSSGVKTDKRDFRSLAASEPSPYARSPVTPRSAFLRSTPKPASTGTVQPSSAPASAAHRNVTSPSSLPRPVLAAASNNNSPLQHRKASMPPAMASVYTPSKNLASRSSNPILRPGSRLSSSTAGGGGSSGRRVPTGHTTSKVFRDGNDADTETGGPSSLRRPPSVLAMGPGKRSSSLFSTSRIRQKDEGNVPALPLNAVAGAEGKPRWRV